MVSHGSVVLRTPPVAIVRGGRRCPSSCGTELVFLRSGGDRPGRFPPCDMAGSVLIAAQEYVLCRDYFVRFTVWIILPDESIMCRQSSFLSTVMSE